MISSAPRRNAQLFGHHKALAAFERVSASGRMPHAWLIAGSPGIGKATLAFWLARTVLSVGKSIADPHDPQSSFFRRVAHGSEPDLFVLERTPHPRTGRMRKEISVDQVRALTTSLHETAVGSGGRVVVVDTADELNLEAANALLKLLEEPPSGVVLLLVSNAPGLMPRTILSRCATLRLKRLNTADMLAALVAAGLADDPEPALLMLANGSPGQFDRLCRTGFAAQYDVLLSTLTTDSPNRARVGDAADSILAFSSAAGSDLAVDVICLLVQRCAEFLATGLLRCPLADREDAKLERLTYGRPLDRWLGMWENLRRLPNDLNHLNVDPRQAYYLALADLAAVPVSSGGK
jgi:DNA polymerase-3 subunit delta'